MFLRLNNKWLYYGFLSLLVTLSYAFHSIVPTMNNNSVTAIKPPYLVPNDTVGIVAPGFFANRGEEALAEAIATLESWGLKVIVGKTIRAKQGLLAGNDALRKQDLQMMLDDPSIKAIFAYRGGHGTTRIIDELDFTRFLVSPKWLVGFSDITTLHFKLHQLDIVSVHGAMIAHFAGAEYKSSLTSLQALLFGESITITAKPSILNRVGAAKAPVVGGNLMMICANIGTLVDLDTRGKILLIEDIDEKLYALDRMMVQLKRTGKLDHLAGLVVGSMSAMKDNSQSPFGKDAYHIIQEHVANYAYPVAFNFPIGHDAPNIAFPHGGLGQLTVSEDAVILSFAD